MEQAYGERDKYMDNVDATVRASRDLLLSVFKKNPKTLSEWGMGVHDSPTVKKGKGSTTTGK